MLLLHRAEDSVRALPPVCFPEYSVFTTDNQMVQINEEKITTHTLPTVDFTAEQWALALDEGIMRLKEWALAWTKESCV